MIVIFDVDGTLINGDSLLLSARLSNSPLRILIAILSIFPWFILYKLRFISTKNFKEKFLIIFKICEKFNSEEKNGNIKWFLPYIKNKLNPEALKRLKMHKSRGDKVVLCSASFDMLLQDFADYLNVDLISTRLKREEKWQSEIITENCKGIEKVNRLKNKFSDFSKCKIVVYGDSEGDKELLKIADLPHYRNFTDQVKEYPLFNYQNILPFLGLFIFSYGFLAVLFRGEVLIRSFNFILPSICKGLILVLIGYFIRYLRWRNILFKLKFSPCLKKDFLAWMGSYAFTATPGKVGEGIRSIILKDKCEIPINKSLLAIFYERLTDLFSVFLIILLNLNILKNWIPLLKINFLQIFFFIFGITIFCFLMAFILNNKYKYLDKFKRNKFFCILKNDMISFKKLFKFKTLMISTFLGSISWFLEGLSLWIIIKDLGQKDFSMGGAAVAHTTAGLFGALSLLPGGLGSMELSMVGILSLQNVPLQISAPATLIIRIITLWFATLLGIICLFFITKKND